MSKTIEFMSNNFIPLFFIITIAILLNELWDLVSYHSNRSIHIANQDIKHWETSPDLTGENTYEICHAGILYYIVRTERDAYILVDALTSTGDIVTCIEY